jgi:hypothetical protein
MSCRISSSADWLEKRSPAAQFQRRAGEPIDRRTTARRAGDAGAYQQPSRRPSPLTTDYYVTIDACPAPADAADHQQHQQQPSNNSFRPAVDRRRCGGDEYDLDDGTNSRSVAFQQQSRQSSLQRGYIESKYDDGRSLAATIAGTRRPPYMSRRAPVADSRCRGTDGNSSDDEPVSFAGTRRHRPTDRRRWVCPPTKGRILIVAVRRRRADVRPTRKRRPVTGHPSNVATADAIPIATANQPRAVRRTNGRRAERRRRRIRTVDAVLRLRRGTAVPTVVIAPTKPPVVGAVSAVVAKYVWQSTSRRSKSSAGRRCVPR